MKIPWFKLFVGDWLSDRRIKSLSYAAKGVYIDLLCLMWQEEGDTISLPLDMKVLASAVGMKESNFEKVWKELVRPGMELFEVSEGKIFSRQLHGLYLDACQKSDKCKGAAMQRWGQVQDHLFCQGESSGSPVDNTYQQMSIERLSEKWNEEMASEGFRRAIKVTSERLSDFIKLKKELPDIELDREETWSNIFNLIMQSDYLSGRTERSNAVGIDFVLDSSHINKLLAGNYSD